MAESYLVWTLKDKPGKARKCSDKDQWQRAKASLKVLQGKSLYQLREPWINPVHLVITE